MGKRKSGKALRDLDELEMEALVLSAGRPSVLEAFYDLTGHKCIQLRWNPLADPFQLEGFQPSDKDFERLAAIRELSDKGYIASLTESGVSDYCVNVSEKAEAVRAALDRIPKTLKKMVTDEVARQKA